MTTTPVRRRRQLRMSVAGRILVANLMMLLGIIVLSTSLIFIDLSNANVDSAEDQLAASAVAIAAAPIVVDTTSGADSEDKLRDYAESMRRALDLDAVVVTSLAQPVSPEENKLYSSDENTVVAVGWPSRETPSVAPALGGNTSTQFVAPPGESGLLFGTAPVWGAGEQAGLVVGVVAAGSTEGNVREEVTPRLTWLVAVGVLSLVLGGVATWLTSRGLRRVTGDYGSQELGTLVEYYDSVLRAVSEGLLLVNREKGIVLRNVEATRLLGMPGGEAHEETPLSEAGLPEDLRELLESGRLARDEIFYTDQTVLVVNQAPATTAGTNRPGRLDTWVVTMRDRTELQELSGELVSVRGFSESLRSQTHEFANRLHTMVSLIEMGKADEALALGTLELDAMHTPADNLLDGFDHPVLSALLLTKIAQANERGITLSLETENLYDQIVADERDLVTVMGNLLDNAFDAVEASGPERGRVDVAIWGSVSSGWTLEVSDDGDGIREEDIDAAFTRGWSTKHDGDDGEGEHQHLSRGVGLSLVVQAVRRLGGAIDVRGRAEEPEQLAGAAFTLWLPGRTAKSPEGERSGRAPGAGA